MYLKVFVSLLCVGYVACLHLPQATPCNGSIFSENVKVEVSGCEPSHRHCPLRRGENYTVSLGFMPTEDFLDKTDARVYGVFPNFAVPYGKRSNACLGAMDDNDVAVVCEVGTRGFHTGRLYKHVSKFAVSPNYPLIQLSVRFVFYDRKSKKNMVCMEVPVEIMDREDPDSNEA